MQEKVELNPILLKLKSDVEPEKPHRFHIEPALIIALLILLVELVQLIISIMPQNKNVSTYLKTYQELNFLVTLVLQ